MNRRGFLRVVAGAGVVPSGAVGTAAGWLGALWAPKVRAVLNPAYEAAPYEAAWMWVDEHNNVVRIGVDKGARRFDENFREVPRSAPTNPPFPRSTEQFDDHIIVPRRWRV